MRIHQRHIISIGLLVIFVLLVVACQPAATPTPEAQVVETDPIVIGVSLPLTGQRGSQGIAAGQGYETWVALVNESGGLLERQIELLVLDNESSDVKVAADYEQLITQDQVDLVVGTQSSFLVIPSSAVAAEHGYAYVEPAGGAPNVFNRGLNNIFFTQPGESARQADPFALYILGLPADQRPQTFAVVTSNDPFSQSVIERMRGLLTGGGIELVVDLQYALDTETPPDFEALAAEVAEADPDLLVGGTQFEDAMGQIAAYRAVGYQPRFVYLTSAPSLPIEFRAALGEATEGIFAAVSWYPEGNDFQNADFVAKYLELFGGAMGEIPEDAANSFTTGQVLQQAVESIQSIDNAALIEELHRGTYRTVVGSLSFDETGAPLGSFMLLQWQGANFVIVGPADRAETDPLAPPKPTW